MLGNRKLHSIINNSIKTVKLDKLKILNVDKMLCCKTKFIIFILALNSADTDTQQGCCRKPVLTGLKLYKFSSFVSNTQAHQYWSSAVLFL